MTPLGARHPEIQQLRRLLGRRVARREAGCFVVEGPKLVDEALASGLLVERVYVEEGTAAPLDATGRTAIVAAGVLARVLDTVTPQPIAAVVETPAHSLAEVVAQDGVVVVADGVGDPGNVGTIARSIEAFGGAGLVLTTGSADPFQPKVVRSSAGAVLRLAIVDGVGPDQVMEACRAVGRPLVVTAMHGGIAPHAVAWPHVAVAVGNEAHGVSDTLARHAELTMTIPMPGPTESLNVAMAATLVCYEAARGRAGN